MLVVVLIFTDQSLGAASSLNMIPLGSEAIFLEFDGIRVVRSCLFNVVSKSLSLSHFLGTRELSDL